MLLRSTFVVKLTCEVAKHLNKNVLQAGRSRAGQVDSSLSRYCGTLATISSEQKSLFEKRRTANISSPASGLIHQQFYSHESPFLKDIRLGVFETAVFQQTRYYRTGSRHRSQKHVPESSKEDSKETGSLEKSVDETKAPAEDPANDSVFQRFKQAYREHGKILIGVHLLTSSVWFGSFFYAASVGIDVVPWLEHIGISETLIKPFRSANVGNIAMAYLMYKLATPARYTVTLGGTNILIRYMRKTGRMDPVPKGDTLRALYKEGREQIKEKRHHVRRSPLRREKDKVHKRH